MEQQWSEMRLRDESSTPSVQTDDGSLLALVARIRMTLKEAGL